MSIEFDPNAPLPTEGGCYLRQPDGSLVPDEQDQTATAPPGGEANTPNQEAPQ